MGMISVDILVDALVLSLHTPTPETIDLIQKLIGLCEKEITDSPAVNDKYRKLYINLISEVLAIGVTVEDAKSVETYLLKFKSNPTIAEDPELNTTLRKLFLDKDELSEEKTEFVVRKIKNVLLKYDTQKNVKKIFGKLSSVAAITDPVRTEMMFDDVRDLCSRIIEDIDGQRISTKGEENTARFVDFQNMDTIAKALEVYKTTAVKNRFCTGLQGMNRALNGGFPLGSSIVFNSRAHNAKSLMLMKMARWAIDLNTVSSEFHNPTCLFFSLENETPYNVMQLFRDIYINDQHQVPPADMTDEDIVRYCYDVFNRKGWKLIVERRLGAEFGYPELVEAFENYVRQGFTPLMCIIDYANMMAKGKGDSAESSTNNLQIKELYTNICNYLKSKNCTFVTAHQLNRKADEVVSNNPIGAVKKFGPDMLADSISVQREVDIVFYQNKELDSSGHAFLTFKLDKHRYENNTPEKYKYFAYPFMGELGLLDDINGPDMSTDNINTYQFEGEETKKEQEDTDNPF